MGGFSFLVQRWPCLRRDWGPPAVCEEAPSGAFFFWTTDLLLSLVNSGEPLQSEAQSRARGAREHPLSE